MDSLSTNADASSPSPDDGDATPSGSKLRAVLVAFGVAVLGFVVGLAVSLVLMGVWVALGFELTTSALLVLGLVGLQGIGFGLVAYAYIRFSGLSFDFVPVSVPSLRDLGYVVGGYLTAFVLVLATLVVITSAFATEPATNEGAQAAAESGLLLWMIPASLLLIGPGEELLFRGIIQGSLRRHFSAAGAIVLATAMFAPAHILSLSGSPQAAALTISILTVPSLVFGFVYERTRNLVVPALCHGLYNATLFTIQAFAPTGGDAGTGLFSAFAALL
ncbi:CPBP family intramembrane metalloprotease [Halobacterium sp. KA-4]|uniref:CPBP family intramembrane glutamic endopeptidase n=1 Tax=Halobacterium sp. KA-4 TaxID=2896367 RepID=UPI001E3DEAA2|nr:type II CAAX endopeptidase family protein [Halobacterium sp. KA-4]MCD2198478.1 CPBP family intramembrane metalloprotease [Halobacterium sp. KA-4]